MSAAVLPFPKKSRRRRVWVHDYREGDPVPVNVATRRIEYAPPPAIVRSPELIILLALMKALPQDVRDQTRRTVRATFREFGDKDAAAASHIMALL